MLLLALVEWREVEIISCYSIQQLLEQIVVDEKFSVISPLQYLKGLWDVTEPGSLRNESTGAFLNTDV